MSLSTGVVHRMKLGEKVFPVQLQILSIKAVVAANSAAAPTRYRVLLMDGQDYISAMAATQMNELITTQQIKQFSIISITNYMINDMNGQKMCVILSADLIASLDHQIPGLHIDAEGYKTEGGPPAQAAPSYQQHQQPAYQQQQPVYQQQQQPAYNPPAAIPSYNAAPAYNPPAAYGAQNTGAYGQPRQQAPPAPAPSAYNNTAYNAAASNPYANAVGGSSGAYGAQNSRPVHRDDSSQSIVPISAINPYSSRWTIKARITAKSDLKKWSNAKGEGTLFSIDLLDNQNGEIRATFFKDSCEKWFPVLEEGKVYTFSGGVLKIVQNRQFSNLKNQYELTFNANSDIHAAADDSAIKTQQYTFVKIDQIGNIEPGQTVDIIGVVKGATEVSEIISQKLGGKALQKRELTLVDDSFCEIRLTLWGEKATTNYEWSTSPIVAIKGCKVGDYQGRTLSTSNNSSVILNPQIPEGAALHNFRAAYPGGVIPVGSSLSSQGGGAGNPNDFTVEKRKTIQSIKDDSLGMGEKPDYITVKGSVSYIKHDTDCWYTACPTPNCNKKVLEGMGGQWSCEKCNLTFPECQRRYILSMTMSDHSGNTWFSLFNDSAEKILGHSAQQLYEMKSDGNEAGYDAVFTEALFKTFVCKVRVKQEQVNDEMRVKCTIAQLNTLDFLAESKQMLEAIRKYQ